MASINVDLNYFEHIKTMRLVARLGPGSDVLPIKLWTHVGKHKAGVGSVVMLETELEHILGWWGEKGALAKALVEIGFVTKEGDTWFVHDWLEHSGHLAYFKERAEKAARKRWGVKRKRSNASSITKTPSKQCPNNTSSMLLSITSDSNKPTPEKLVEWFGKIWNVYPQKRRHGKKTALKRFLETVTTLEQAKQCARALETYLKSDAVQKGYIMRGSRWFDEWEDHADAVNESRNSAGIYNAESEPGTTRQGPGSGGFVTSHDVLRGTPNILPARDFRTPDEPDTPGT